MTDHDASERSKEKDNEHALSEVSRQLDQLLRPQVATNVYAGDPANVDGGLIASKYQLQECIGSGSFGLVYRAVDTSDQSIVAIKLPRPEVLLAPEQLERFRREAAVSLRLSHPNIVSVLDFDIDSLTPHIVMKWCDGLDLSHHLARLKLKGAHVDWRAAAKLISCVARAIEHAHQNRVTHRDLKPSNILLELFESPDNGDALALGLEHYKPLVTDFGLAHLVDASVSDTRSSLLIGTPVYLAPEQIERFAGQPSSTTHLASADIYALGMILFEMLAGQPAVEGDTWFSVVDAIRSGKRLSIRQLRPDLPRDLASICECCLSRDPVGRYRSADQLADDLDACVAAKHVRPVKRSWLERIRFFGLQSERIWQAGLYAVAIHTVLFAWLIAGVWVVFFRQDLTQDLGLVKAQHYSPFFDAIRVILTMHFPMIAVGWMTFRERGWAVWLGTCLAMLCLLPPVLMAMGFNGLFVELYQNSVYHRVMFATLVFLMMSVQVALFLFALFAHRHRQLTSS